MSSPILPAVASQSLALAMIESSSAPLLLLDGALVVVAASLSFCRAFDIDPVSVPGNTLSAIGAGEWAVPQLDSLLTATVSGFAEIDAYEMDLIRPDKPPRRLILNAHKLDYTGAVDIRLLLGVLDVTDARAVAMAKDDLLREKVVLLQELQHRVANSLQIIASVLMQSARRVQSDEARVHLSDAHNRVMSIAALQRQLTTSSVGVVDLRAYLTVLCQTLGASMIHDATRISIRVTVDDSMIDADKSVSIGLIVTELVINALKHAFPGRNQKGTITVDFQSNGSAWTLSVSDDGVGIPSAPTVIPTGLGTSIVAALTKQLGATAHLADGKPGTIAWIIHA